MNLKTFLAALLVMGTLTACGGGNDEATEKNRPIPHKKQLKQRNL